MEKNLNYISWILIAMTYLAGAIFIAIMDVDAAQYASISREMTENNSWLVVKHRMGDYLDKPPLLFWLSALFFKIFGFSDFVYRLPSLIATGFGLFAVYRIGKILYDAKTGHLAALIVASCQAWFLFNHDIRTDTLLSAFVLISIWQILEFDQNKKIIHIIWGFLAIGLALLAKGPIGLIIPVFALSSYWLGKGTWKQFFRPEWLLGILIIFLTISPMLYGLYLQWGTEGLYFFFWKQSFGRITGENSWQNDSGPFFFIHTFLWSFLPWSILAVWTIFKRSYAFWRDGAKSEVLTLGAFVLTFIALSFSRYKLPHYIFPLFPFAAIMLAHEIVKINENKNSILKFFNGLQIFVNVLVWIVIGLLCFFVFPIQNIFIMVLLIAGFGINFYIYFSKYFINKLIFNSIYGFCLLNLTLNLHFYPNLLAYQSGGKVAAFIQKNHILKEEFACFGLHPNSLDFYLRTIVSDYPKIENLINDLAAKPMWIYTDEQGKKTLENSGAIIENSIRFEDFPVTKLNLKFLNSKTRAKVVGHVYLLNIKGIVG